VVESRRVRLAAAVVSLGALALLGAAALAVPWGGGLGILGLGEKLSLDDLEGVGVAGEAGFAAARTVGEEAAAGRAWRNRVKAAPDAEVQVGAGIEAWDLSAAGAEEEARGAAGAGAKTAGANADAPAAAALGAVPAAAGTAAAKWTGVPRVEVSMAEANGTDLLALAMRSDPVQNRYLPQVFSGFDMAGSARYCMPRHRHAF